MRKILIVLNLAALLVMPARAFAADATLSSPDDTIRWTDGPVSGLVGAPEACAVQSCAEYTVEVALPDDTWTEPGSVQIMIRWPDESQDLDLFVYGPNGSQVAQSAGPVSTAEAVALPNALNGVYRIVVVPAIAEDVTFEGLIEVERDAPVSPIRDLLPDLVSRPARNLQIATSAYLFDPPVPSLPTGCYPEETLEQGALRCLRFDQIVVNDGDGPFELRYRVDGIASEDTRDLVQRIYASDGSYRERYAATYVFHATHAHFHYEQFAQSHLWASNEAGARLGDAPIRSSRKNGFCMVDVEADRFGEKGDAPRTYIPPGCLVPTDIDPASGEASAISGISVGWADVYNWFLPDQFIEISGVPDGYYLLENVADQAGTVQETDESNNSAMVLIRLCGDRAEIVGGESVCG